MRTAYGATPFVKSVQGTCQGSVLGVKHYAAANYPIHLHYMETGEQFTTSATSDEDGIQLSLTVYVDDERHHFASAAAMLDRLGITTSLNAHLGAKLNPAKTSLSYINTPHIEAPLLPNPDGTLSPIRVVSPFDGTKRLGAYDNLHGDCSAPAAAVLTNTNRFMKALGRTRRQFSQIRYLINSALMPQLVFPLISSYVDMALLKKVDGRLRSLAKNALGVATSFPNRFWDLHNGLMVGPGVSSLVHMAAESRVMAAFSMANTDAPGGKLFIARTKAYQLEVKRPEFPFIHPPTLLPMLLGRSWCAEIAESLRLMNTSMACPGPEWTTTPPRCGDRSIASIVTSPRLYQQVLQGTMEDSTTTPYLWLSSFVNPAGSSFLTWQDYRRRLRKAAPATVSPKWFDKLQKLACLPESNQLVEPMQSKSIFPPHRFAVGDWVMMPKTDANLQPTDHQHNDHPWLFKMISLAVSHVTTSEHDCFQAGTPSTTIRLNPYKREPAGTWVSRVHRRSNQLVDFEEQAHYLTKVDVTVIPSRHARPKVLLFETDMSRAGLTGATPQAVYNNMVDNWNVLKRCALARCIACDGPYPELTCSRRDCHLQPGSGLYHANCAAIDPTSVDTRLCPTCVGIPTTRCPRLPVDFACVPLDLPLSTNFAGDGSVTRTEGIAGFGAVVASVEPTITRAQFRVNNRVQEISSHITELQSMVWANTMAPLHSTGILLQDSQSAIQVYNRAFKAAPDAPHWTRKLSTDNNRFNIRCLYTLRAQRDSLLPAQWVTFHKLNEAGISDQQRYWRTMNNFADQAVSVASTTIGFTPVDPYYFPPGADRCGLFDGDHIIISTNIRKALRHTKDKAALESGQSNGTGSCKLLSLHGTWDWEAMKPLQWETDGALRFRLRLVADSLPTRHKLHQRYPDEIEQQCPLCLLARDPGDLNPVPNHTMAHVLGAGEPHCVQATNVPELIATAAEATLRKVAAHPLVQQGQAERLQILGIGRITADARGNPPLTDDAHDPMVNLDLVAAQPNWNWVIPASTLLTAASSLGIMPAHMKEWSAHLKNTQPTVHWAPIPALWSLVHQFWSTQALVTTRFCPHWPADAMTGIQIPNPGASVQSMTLSLAPLLTGIQTVMVDSSGDHLNSPSSGSLISATVACMENSMLLDKVIILTSSEELVLGVGFDVETIVTFPAGSFPVIPHSAYAGLNVGQNKTARPPTTLLPAARYIHLVTKRIPNLPLTCPRGWPAAAQRWTSIHINYLYAPQQERPDFTNPTAMSDVRPQAESLTPLWNSISWMSLPADSPSQQMQALPQHIVLSNLTPLQQRTCMLPVGSHHILDQISVPVAKRQLTMRKLHASILTCLRAFWIDHCSVVAEHAPLPPREPQPAIGHTDLVATTKLAKLRLVMQRRAADWMDTRAAALLEGSGESSSESDSDGEGEGRAEGEGDGEGEGEGEGAGEGEGVGKGEGEGDEGGEGEDEGAAAELAADEDGAEATVEGEGGLCGHG